MNYALPLHCVSLLPQDIHGPEDREMLARLAARTDDDQSADSEAAIEKYLRSVLAVENILTLDRLRQVRKCSAMNTWGVNLVCVDLIRISNLKPLNHWAIKPLGIIQFTQNM